MVTDHILTQISNSLAKIQDDVTAIKVDNSAASCHLKHLEESIKSDRKSIDDHEVKLLAFERHLAKTMAEAMMVINDNQTKMKEFVGIETDKLKKKIEDIQGGYVKYLSVVASISAAIGTGVGIVVAKFPSVGKFFNW